MSTYFTLDRWIALLQRVGKEGGKILTSYNLQTESGLSLTAIKKNIQRLREKGYIAKLKGNFYANTFAFPSLEEIAMILEVLKSHRESWSTVHSFKQEKTPIKIEWEQNNQERLWISVGKYNKMLSIAQIKILTALLTHLFKEKIEFATIPLNLGDASQSKETVNIKRENIRNTESALKNVLVIKEEIVSPSSQNTNSNEQPPIRIVKKDSDSTSLLGIIKAETKKAILIEFGDHKQTWIPKSQIHSEFDTIIEKEQEFIIDTWILKKNKIVA